MRKYERKEYEFDISLERMARLYFNDFMHHDKHTLKKR